MKTKTIVTTAIIHGVDSLIIEDTNLILNSKLDAKHLNLFREHIGGPPIILLCLVNRVNHVQRLLEKAGFEKESFVLIEKEVVVGFVAEYLTRHSFENPLPENEEFNHVD